MNLPIRLRPEALEELSEAWQWYETKREGLGDEFRACIDAAMAEIARSPLTCGRVRGEVKQKIARRFPYAVIFLVEADHVEVLAVFHSSRNPRRWQERVR